MGRKDLDYAAKHGYRDNEFLTGRKYWDDQISITVLTGVDEVLTKLPPAANNLGYKREEKVANL